MFPPGDEGKTKRAHLAVSPLILFRCTTKHHRLTSAGKYDDDECVPVVS